MNETKVNTNNPAASPFDEKNIDPNTRVHIGSIPMPYGRMHIEKGSAEDHTTMRTGQLVALLQLMQGDSIPSYFQGMAQQRKDNLLWLAYELAGEIDEMMPLLVKDTWEMKR